MEKYRLFVAIDIDNDGISKIIPLQNALKKDLKEVRWTKENTWHITLKFLGEVEKSKLGEICKVLNDLNYKGSPFNIEFEKLDYFPDYKYPRVLILEIKNNPHLSSLVNLIEDKFFFMGFKKEDREFRGHLTLGRIKDTRKFLQINKDYKKVIDMKFDHSFYMDRFYLYRSELRKEGPQYTKLLEIKI